MRADLFNRLATRGGGRKERKENNLIRHAPSIQWTEWDGEWDGEWEEGVWTEKEEVRF